MAISHCYWHLMVENGNLALLLTSSHQAWQFHTATDMKWSIMAISHCYWHLVVKNSNITLLLTSSGQEWQFHISTDIKWSRMAISHCYWHQVVKNGNFKLLLTSRGQEWQLADLLKICQQIYPPPNASRDIYYGRYLAAILYSARKGGNFLLCLNN